MGTGFFIAENLFLTARHVLNAPFGRDGKQMYPISMLHFNEEGQYIDRPILRCALHPAADIAVGVAAPMTRNSDNAPLKNKILTLDFNLVTEGAHVMTYAYPRHENIRTESSQILKLMPAYYDGRISEYLPNGRDRVMLPGPCYRTTIAIHHGASGGPVFSKNGSVFAVNSTGWDGTEDAYISCIKGILDLSIDGVILNDPPPRSVGIPKLIRAGYIIVV